MNSRQMQWPLSFLVCSVLCQSQHLYKSFSELQTYQHCVPEDFRLASCNRPHSRSTRYNSDKPRSQRTGKDRHRVRLARA